MHKIDISKITQMGNLIMHIDHGMTISPATEIRIAFIEQMEMMAHNMNEFIETTMENAMSADAVRDLISRIDDLEEEIALKEMIIQAFEKSFDIERNELMKDYIESNE